MSQHPLKKSTKTGMKQRRFLKMSAAAPLAIGAGAQTRPLTDWFVVEQTMAWFYRAAAAFRFGRGGLIAHDDVGKRLVVSKRLALDNSARFVRSGYVCLACEPLTSADVLPACPCRLLKRGPEGKTILGKLREMSDEMPF